MTYGLTHEDFEETVAREFAFLAAAGFAGPTFERGGEPYRGRFEGDDLVVWPTAWPSEGAMDTYLQRRSLGLELMLETVDALNPNGVGYPIDSGLPWESRHAFERRVALEATLLAANLAAARDDDAIYEEVGSRV